MSAHGARNRADDKPCRRCGVPVFWSRKATVPGICRDCREVDPAYVRAIRTGVPITAAS